MGAYVGGKVRPENGKEDRVDRRLAENQAPDRRCNQGCQHVAFSREECSCSLKTGEFRRVDGQTVGC